MASILQSIEIIVEAKVLGVEQITLSDGGVLYSITSSVGTDIVQIWGSETKVLKTFTGEPVVGETYSMQVSVKAKSGRDGARLSLSLIALAEEA